MHFFFNHIKRYFSWLWTNKNFDRLRAPIHQINFWLSYFLCMHVYIYTTFVHHFTLTFCRFMFNYFHVHIIKTLTNSHFSFPLPFVTISCTLFVQFLLYICIQILVHFVYARVIISPRLSTSLYNQYLGIVFAVSSSHSSYSILHTTEIEYCLTGWYSFVRIST
jgi:hypothetical protein